MPVDNGEHIRITLVPASGPDRPEDAVRFEREEPTGHLRRGPEVPCSLLPELATKVVALLQGS